MFENIIDHIPDSICKIDSLLFIAAPNNSQLKTIPECIANLPNLEFISLVNCPNLKVPKALEQYDAGQGFYHKGE
jgi:Leucine-rich repeat (LRR) protein